MKLLPRLAHVIGALAIAIALLANPVCAQDQRGNSQLSPDKIREDIDHFSKVLPEKHVNLFFKLDKSTFEKQVSALKSRASDLDYESLALGLSKILASVGDGHTAISFDDFSLKFFPINFKALEDGIFVRSIEPKHGQCLKGKLISIGGVNADQLIEKLGEILPHDNSFALRSMVDTLGNCQQLLIECGCQPQGKTMELVIQCEDMERRIELTAALPNRLQLTKWKTAPNSFRIASQKSRLDHWNDLIDGEILYFKYNHCRNKPSFDKLVRGTAGFVAQKGKQVKAFVVDLRDNGGGDSRVMGSLTQFLKSNQNLNQKGKLFVITSRRTFSSAVLNAIELKNNTQATLIGEPPGGRPNHYGEVKTMQLPHSRIKVFYSTKYFAHATDVDSDTLPLDVAIPLTSSNWFSSEDPFLAAVKAQIKSK